MTSHSSSSTHKYGLQQTLPTSFVLSTYEPMKTNSIFFLCVSVKNHFGQSIDADAAVWVVCREHRSEGLTATAFTLPFLSLGLETIQRCHTYNNTLPNDPHCSEHENVLTSTINRLVISILMLAIRILDGFTIVAGSTTLAKS